jgi:hypothetical protein
MSEKDLAEELERLKAENKKLKQKLKPKKSYVLEQAYLFNGIYKQLLEFPGNDGSKKYFFERKPRDGGTELELVFKLNLFVKHLLEYKIRINDKIPEEQLNTRLSMDTASLIASLQEGRVKRPRKAGKGIDTKPTKKLATKAKKAKEKPDLPNHPEIEMKAKDEPAVRSVTIEDSPKETAGGKDWQKNGPSFG